MGPHIWVAAAIVTSGLVLVTVAMITARHRNQTEQLQILFGPEYDRAVKLYGTKEKAEAALENRRAHLETLGVHELSPSEREQYLGDWETILATSRNDSISTLMRADTLLTEIMRDEGCPADDADERQIDLAMIHPTVAEEYRAVNSVMARQNLGLATPEECRRAVLRFATIFDHILGQADLTNRLRRAS